MTTNPLAQFSDQLAGSAEQAGRSVVMVDGRDRFPATGILYSPALILTADHVLERDEEIKVGFADGAETTAALVGRDPTSDLALLRLANPAAAAISQAEAPARIGQIVLALGRPGMAGLQASLGVVSGMGSLVRSGKDRAHHHRSPAIRSVEQFIRTDAIPYPGFSGGPLVDVEGRLLGMNTSGLARGMALAIPTDRLRQIASALEKHGSVKRGYLGIRSQHVPLPAAQQELLKGRQENGLLVVWIESDSPAARSGLLVGDILVAVDGNPVEDHGTLQMVLTGELVGCETSLEILRGGRLEQVSITIAERKD